MKSGHNLVTALAGFLIIFAMLFSFCWRLLANQPAPPPEPNKYELKGYYTTAG